MRVPFRSEFAVIIVFLLFALLQVVLLFDTEHRACYICYNKYTPLLLPRG